MPTSRSANIHQTEIILCNTLTPLLHTHTHTHAGKRCACACAIAVFVVVVFFFFFASLGSGLLRILLLDSFLCARLNLVAVQQKCSHLEFIIAAASAVASCTF